MKMQTMKVLTVAMVAAAGLSSSAFAYCSACAAKSSTKTYEPAKSGVEKPSIKPMWSGAKVGTWTMDYETALAKAAKEGKYTLLYFSGMWWCPRCKELEKYVLKDSTWTKFVKNRGLYLTVIDSPYRNGKDRWCWLWDASYRKSAKLTAEDAAAVIAERYELQNDCADPLNTRLRTATNYVVEVTGKGKNLATNYTVFAEQPVSEYWSVNYPGIIIIAPDGTEAGRFIPDTSENPDYTLPTALEYCMDQVDEAINPEALKPFVGNWTLAFAQTGCAGYGSLALTVNAKGSVKISGYAPNGTKVSNTVPFVTGAESCYIPVRFNKKDAEPAFTLRLDNETQKVTLECEGGAYALVGASAANLAAPEYVVCTIGDFPEEIGGYEVIEETVPDEFLMTRKNATFKSDEGISFKYTQKTGVLSGTFKISVLKKGKPSSVTVTVSGVWTGEKGYGAAFPKGASSSASVVWESASAPVPYGYDDDCDECGL